MAYHGFRKDWALSPQQKIDAREALSYLDGTGISLAEAARRAVEGKKALRRIFFQQAVDEFLVKLLAKRGRPATFSWYETKLARPLASFGSEFFDTISHADLVNFFERQEDWEPGTKAGVARALRAIWKWGMRSTPQMTTLDITTGLASRGPRNEGDAKFFSVEQVATIISGSTHFKNAFAMLFFAGIRPEELAGRGKDRLLWKHVDTIAREIRIPSNISKTKKPRIIQGLPDTLWLWITPGKPSAPISLGRVRQATDRGKALLSLKEWPHDATRHTFATYALAHCSDAGKVSEWLGHEGKPTLLHQTYRGLSSKIEADKFWQLTPGVK